MLFEDAGEMGGLFVAEIEADFLEGAAREDTGVSFCHAMVSKPGCKGGVVMNSEVALECAETDGAELGHALGPVVRLASDISPSGGWSEQAGSWRGALAGTDAVGHKFGPLDVFCGKTLHLTSPRRANLAGFWLKATLNN